MIRPAWSFRAVARFFWAACAGVFLVPGSWFSGPASSGFLFVFVPPLVSFYWPRASRSSSPREGRRVKRRGTDPRTGTGRRPKDRLLQVSLCVRLCVRRPGVCSFSSSLRCLLYFIICGFGLPPLAQTLFSS